LKERYKAKALELNGPYFNWLNSPVDIRALYECSCGCRHGKWSIFNGIIDDIEALAEVKNKHASSATAKCRRQEEAEHIRKEAHESRLAKEYAHNMAEWGKMAQIYNENMQKFMEVRSDMHIYLLFLLVLSVYYLIMCIVCDLIIEYNYTHWNACQCGTSSSFGSSDASEMCYNVSK
jgi:hypothetical protein